MFGVLALIGAAYFLVVVAGFLVTGDDDQPSGWSNPWMELDIEQIENLEFRKSGDKFLLKGRSKIIQTKSVVQLTLSTEGRVLSLLIQQADSPPTTKFLYKHTDDLGRFEFDFKKPANIERIILKRSGHVLWNREE